MVRMKISVKALEKAIDRGEIAAPAANLFMQQIADAARAVAEIAIAAAIARAGGAPVPVPPEILDAQAAVTRGDDHYSFGRWLLAIKEYIEASEEASSYEP